jgi:hypothetical protein
MSQGVSQDVYKCNAALLAEGTGPSVALRGTHQFRHELEVHASRAQRVALDAPIIREERMNLAEPRSVLVA